MSLEVVEHLQASVGEQFVACLAEASDVILFSAAFTNQGGTNHINERPHSYWANAFQRLGYSTFDLFRPVFWTDERICYWYRQNTFLYARNESAPFQLLVSMGLAPLSDFRLMDCVHPGLLEKKTREANAASELSFLQHLSAL